MYIIIYYSYFMLYIFYIAVHIVGCLLVPFISTLITVTESTPYLNQSPTSYEQADQ